MKFQILKKPKFWIGTAIVALLLAGGAYAINIRTGLGGITEPNYWKLVATTLSPKNPAWTVSVSSTATETDPIWTAASTTYLRTTTAASTYVPLSATGTWNTAYTDRLKWDGGATDLVAATGRTSLGLGDMALLSSADYMTTGTLASTYHPLFSVLAIANGGTGTTTAPTTGQLLMGNASGGYNLVPTSSLGISGGGTASGTVGLIQYSDGTGAFNSDAGFSRLNSTTTNISDTTTFKLTYNNGASTTLEIPFRTGNLLVGTGVGIPPKDDSLYNTCVGNNSCGLLKSATQRQARNVVLGYGAAQGTENNERIDNVIIGYAAQTNWGNWSQNVILGSGAGATGAATGQDNVCIGFKACQAPWSQSGIGAVSNIGIGLDTLTALTTGDYNVVIGNNGGATLTTGINNTLLGVSTDIATNALTTTTAIGYGAITGASNKGVLGNGGIQWGIGTSTPAYTLHIATDGTATTTLAVGVSGTKSGCIVIQDIDLGGWTYITTLDGVMTATTTAC